VIVTGSKGDQDIICLISLEKGRETDELSLSQDFVVEGGSEDGPLTGSSRLRSLRVYPDAGTRVQTGITPRLFLGLDDGQVLSMSLDALCSRLNPPGARSPGCLTLLRHHISKSMPSPAGPDPDGKYSTPPRSRRPSEAAEGGPEMSSGRKGVTPAVVVGERRTSWEGLGLSSPRWTPRHSPRVSTAETLVGSLEAPVSPQAYEYARKVPVQRWPHDTQVQVRRL
jgi:hypothetical protein